MLIVLSTEPEVAVSKVTCMFDILYFRQQTCGRYAQE